ncbi:hypothetical protein PORUE0001_1429 [Porphyromonas uenonis 60-3]|uniref:TerD domain-containing protein n=1 Tax=Porphyromonas uenonis 60-3 TaxID=596327 RepID=C2MDD4_9PORP|nr:hypothetical protein [Porphyromonas uenonis]EEK16261.1 hypothetical protein PORUE0001_1429 [Porphyromonas uenonis 60-3]
MAEVKLKKKITLRKKQEQADFTFDGKLKVKLFWKEGVIESDMDLCLFFKKKDGSVGGVFSNEYRGKKSDLGSLDQFPYILHMGDAKEATGDTEESEQINVASLDEIDEAYACIVNYTAAVNELDVTYSQASARIEIQSDSGDYLEVLADSPDEGPVYCVCSIKNNGGTYALKNESQVMDLSRAFEDIPGFALICN